MASVTLKTDFFGFAAGGAKAVVLSTDQWDFGFRVPVVVTLSSDFWGLSTPTIIAFTERVSVGERLSFIKRGIHGGAIFLSEQLNLFSKLGLKLPSLFRGRVGFKRGYNKNTGTGGGTPGEKG